MSVLKVPVPKRRPPTACVVGVSGPDLTEPEKEVLGTLNPFGVILFARNVQSPDQLRRLITQCRSVLGRADAPVLVDQEGGRVRRLKPPHWRQAPAAARFGAIYDQNAQAGREACYLNARLIAADLVAVGINVNCAPVLDVPVPGADNVIGDRAFSRDPDRVAALGAAALAGFMSAGVIPFLKHLPGHGRAKVDSHEALPVVTTDQATLKASDFKPFRALRYAPYAMSAHIVFTAIDPHNPATQSKTVIEQIIRGDIGFQGCLFSDDLNMGALTGEIDERAGRALEAGCDVALQCSGQIADLQQLIGTVPPLQGDSLARAAAPLSMNGPLSVSDPAAWTRRLDALLRDFSK